MAVSDNDFFPRLNKYLDNKINYSDYKSGVINGVNITIDGVNFLAIQDKTNNNNITLNAGGNLKQGMEYCFCIRANADLSFSIILGTGVDNPVGLNLGIKLQNSSYAFINLLAIGSNRIVIKSIDININNMYWYNNLGTSLSIQDKKYNISFTPTGNFNVQIGGGLIEGEVYILKVNPVSTAYTMTLGSGITNMGKVNLTLTANKQSLFVFQATDATNLQLLSVINQ